MPLVTTDAPWALILRAHRAPLLLTVCAVVAVLDTTTRAVIIYLPNSSGSIRLPYVILLGAMSAVIAVALSTPRLGTIDNHPAADTARTQDLLCYSYFAVSATLTTLPAVLIPDATHPPVVVLRTWFMWTGLALIGTRTLGPQRAWLLPASGIGLIVAFGYDQDKGPRWFNVINLPPDHTPILLAAIAVFAIGLLARSLTPRRARRLRRLRRI